MRGFYIAGGTLPANALSYVARRADHDLYAALTRGDFCYVLTARQTGKSSMMARAAARLRDEGFSVVVLDLTEIGQNLVPEQWYNGLLVLIGQQLRLETELSDFWNAHAQLGPCQRLFMALREVVLAKPEVISNQSSVISSPSSVAGEVTRDPNHASRITHHASLVIFVDELDVVRSLPFSTDEFFAAIRACYNRRIEDKEFERLTFCLLGVATPSDLIRDTRTTPFNIGHRIELNDFTPAEAAPLAKGLERESVGASERGSGGVGHAPCATLHASRLLDRILFWTEGHPYLTQRLCSAVLEKATDPAHRDLPNSPSATRLVDDLCHELFFSDPARERDDNLVFVRERILRSDVDRASLLHLYEKVLQGARLPDDERNPLVSVLRLAGIVQVTRGGLRERNRIYERVFDRAWVRANMPDAEMRRQRAAFRRGVVRATAIAGVVVVGMIVMVLIAMGQAAKARRALAQSYLSQARAGRTSGVSGQRYDSLTALREARGYHANEAVLRDEAIACLALPDLKEKTQTFYPLNRTNVSELNPDLEISATAEMDGSITLCKLNNGQLLPTLPGFGLRVRQLRFSPKESFLLAEYDGGSKNKTVVWDWQKGQKLFEVPHGIHAAAIDFSADGRKLALGQSNGRVAVYGLPQGEILLELELKWESGLPRAPQVLRFNPSGDLLAESCLDDLNVQVWDLNTGQKAWRLFHPDKVFDLAWHPHGELLATACGDARIYVWDTNRADKPIGKLTGHENGVRAITFNHRGTLLASAGLDETLRLWIPAADRQMSRRLDGERFEHLQFSSRDDVLIANREKFRGVQAWDVAGDEYLVLQVRTGPADQLNSIDFSSDGKWLAAASGERAMIWDCSSGREAGALSLVRAHAASFSASSQHLIASTESGLFQYPLNEMTNEMQPGLQLGTMQRLAQVPDELGAMAMSLNPASAALVHQSEVRLVLLEDTASAGRPILAGKHYHWLALHPQALWLAAMAKDSTSIDLWNLSTNAGAQAPFTIPGSEYFVFSPDGKWLVTCWGGQFQFYRVGSFQAGTGHDPAFSIPRTPASNQHAPIAFTRDGAMVALASSRYIVQLLKLTEDNRNPAKLIASLESPDRSPLEMLAFSPDGRRLAAATMNLTIQLWNLALLRESLAELNLDHDWPKFR